MFKLAARLAWRDWRGGELSLLLIALILAITSVTSISLFTNQVKQSMQAQGADLIAADLRLNTSQPVSTVWREKAQELSLQQAHLSQFQAMVFADQGMQLARIKAVSNTYPLRGKISVSTAAFDLGQVIERGPKQGEIWPDSRLLASLNTSVNETIDVGQLSLKISRILISDPDQASGFSSFAPSAMMNLADLAATEAVQTGSRVRHKWLLAGNEDALSALKQNITPELTPGQKWQTPKDGNANVAATLDKAEQFLLLAGSLAVVLAGVALSLSARRYSLRQAKHVALLKCLGLKPQQLRPFISKPNGVFGINRFSDQLASSFWFVPWVIATCVRVYSSIIDYSATSPLYSRRGNWHIMFVGLCVTTYVGTGKSCSCASISTVLKPKQS